MTGTKTILKKWSFLELICIFSSNPNQTLYVCLPKEREKTEPTTAATVALPYKN